MSIKTISKEEQEMSDSYDKEILNGLEKITVEIYQNTYNQFANHKDHIKHLVLRFVDKDIQDWQVEIIVNNACIYSDESYLTNLNKIKKAIKAELI